MNLAGFYRAFEERFYAPRSVIKALREQYLPYVSPLASIYPGASSFDVGCGRGEWLELMQSSGFNPFGVDLDEGMLQACHEQGLAVAQGDAIAYLQTLDNESQVVVSAFHVVEHISFDQLQTLVSQALRVLKPGGLLIMETPNPENIEVATRNFYLDPTHQRPVPPMLLGFLPEFHGFARVATLRLQERSDIHIREDIKLTDVLTAVSPDYAVVAQKHAEPEIARLFDNVFATPLGVDLHNLANRFDLRWDNLLTAHHQTRQGLESLQIQAKDQHGQMHALRVDVEKFHGDIQSLHAEIRNLYASLSASQQECGAMRNSLSWKITAPLRGLVDFAASPVSFILAKILQHPNLSERINKVLLQFPGLHARLRSTAIAHGLRPEAPLANEATHALASVADLSPRAQKIHAKLEQEIARRKG